MTERVPGRDGEPPANGPTAQEKLCKELCDRYTRLKKQRDRWMPEWQEIAKFVLPRRTAGLTGTLPALSQDAERLYDSTAIYAVQTLANGTVSNGSSPDSVWFVAAPGPQQDGDESLVSLLAKASEICRENLALSNFYTSQHEATLDWAAFGTSCLYGEYNERKGLMFQHWPIGTFVIDENADGDVDTVMRELKRSVRQMVQQFGLEKCSGKVQKLHAAGKLEDQVTVIHAVYPREERDATKLDVLNMPWAACYFEEDGKHMLFEGGHEEQPFFVNRFLEWGTATGELWGYAPAMLAMPDIRQVNILQKDLDIVAAKKARPPVLAHESLEGEIDPNPNGVTYFSSDMQGQEMPRAWLHEGRIEIEQARVEARQLQINKAFLVDLFKMFEMLDPKKQMTATEVIERVGEKVSQFSPAFTRRVVEFFNPLLERVFNLLLRRGFFPAELMDKAAEQGLSYRIEYRSKLALALQQQPLVAFQKLLARIQLYAQVKPDVLDNYDFDKSERDTALAEGLPVDFLRSPEDRDAMRQARAEQMAQQQQMEQMALAAEAAGKVGNMKADSPVAQALAMAGGAGG